MVGSPSTIVIKVGTSSLVRADKNSINISNLARICETVRNLKEEGHRVVVVSSGAVGVGCIRRGLANRPKEMAKKQALAAAGQVHLMRYYDDFFSAIGLTCAQVMLTLDNLANHNQYTNTCGTFNELFEYDIVPVVNENDTVAVEELRLGDNDTLSAKVATAVRADWLFLLTDVDALYTSNPQTNPDATPIRHVHDIAQLQVDTSTHGSQWGTGGMATKLTAARIATAAGCNTVICSCDRPESMIDILAGQPIGTVFYQHPKALKGKKRWILMVPCKGQLWIDAGAVRAVAQRAKSLFSAGIVRVVGEFGAQDAVQLCNSDGVPFAQGLCNYSHRDVIKLKGVSSREFQDVLGFGGSEEIVHRDNISMITLRNPPALGVALEGSASAASLAEGASLTEAGGGEPGSSRERGGVEGGFAAVPGVVAAAAAVGAVGLAAGATGVAASARGNAVADAGNGDAPGSGEHAHEVDGNLTDAEGNLTVTDGNITDADGNATVTERASSLSSEASGVFDEAETGPGYSSPRWGSDSVMSFRPDERDAATRQLPPLLIPTGTIRRSDSSASLPPRSPMPRSPAPRSSSSDDRPNPLPSPASGSFRGRAQSPQHGAQRSPSQPGNAQGATSNGQGQEVDPVLQSMLSPDMAAAIAISSQGPIREATEADIAARRAIIAAAKAARSADTTPRDLSSTDATPRDAPASPPPATPSPQPATPSAQQSTTPASTASTAGSAPTIQPPSPSLPAPALAGAAAGAGAVTAGALLAAVSPKERSPGQSSPDASVAPGIPAQQQETVLRADPTSENLRGLVANLRQSAGNMAERWAQSQPPMPAPTQRAAPLAAPAVAASAVAVPALAAGPPPPQQPPPQQQPQPQPASPTVWRGIRGGPAPSPMAAAQAGEGPAIQRVPSFTNRPAVGPGEQQPSPQGSFTTSPPARTASGGIPPLRAPPSRRSMFTPMSNHSVVRTPTPTVSPSAYSPLSSNLQRQPSGEASTVRAGPNGQQQAAPILRKMRSEISSVGSGKLSPAAGRAPAPSALQSSDVASRLTILKQREGTPSMPGGVASPRRVTFESTSDDYGQWKRELASAISAESGGGAQPADRSLQQPVVDINDEGWLPT